MRVVATAGHVDHGKSSLVRALTGTDPDRFAEEKRRGLTIDLGFAHTVLPSGEGVSFVDVPGHTRFLSNMLAGVGAVDACMFVVAATEGWMPQSEEHLRIIDLFGIEHGLIAMTKRDLVDDDLAELARFDIVERVAGTFLEHAPIVEVSATTGQGLDELRAALNDLVASTPPAADRGRPRLWIDRAFAAKGSGTVVTGTLTGGPFRVDDTVAIEPGRRRARIRALQTLGASVNEIGPGNRVAINLNGVAHDEVARGDAVIGPDRWHLTDRFDASLDVLDTLTHEVSRRGAYVAYVGSREMPVRVRVLGAESLDPGAHGFVRIFCPVELAVLPGDRFVLRESGRDETVGGGEILDIDPVTKASVARPDRTLTRLLTERGPMPRDRVERLTGNPVLDDAGSEPDIADVAIVGDWVMTRSARDQIEERLRALVADAGELGADIAALDPVERAVLSDGDWVSIDAGRARPADAVDAFADHPLSQAIKDGGFAPETPADADRATIRELVSRGVLVERDKILFHRDNIERAAHVAAELLGDNPAGFTVAEFRDHTDTSRKFALALVAELDATGVTRRRDDVRIAGPRLPER